MRSSRRSRCTAAVAGLLLIGVLAGCGSHVKLKPVPVIYGPGRVELASVVPESKRTPDLRVFYATNRAAKGPADDRTYTNGMGKSLRLGAAHVRVAGKDGAWGEIGKGNPEFRVESFHELGRLPSGGGGAGGATTQPAGAGDEAAAFVAAVNEQLATRHNKQVGIYVHGFRTNTRWETEIMAKLYHLSGRGGAMVCFAWPSRQRLHLYGADVKRARASAPQLADLIELLATRTDAERINILSYSAGATLAADALVRLRERYPDDDADALSRRLRVGNVIFAASDLDLKTFATTQIKPVRDVADHVVVYVADDDRALGMSSLGPGGSRLGRPDLKELEVTKADLERAASDKELQVIDVSDVPGAHASGVGFGGHGYWYANDWVITDVLVGFRWQIPAGERGLVQRPGKARWFFPKDYPERVTAAVLRQAGPRREEGAPEAPAAETGRAAPH
jgi:esterase/lipase superfamily enzyme